MIKQSITKYNEPVWTPTVHYPQYHNTWTAPLPKQMGKLEYALYLRNLPLKKGMLVVSKYLGDYQQYHTWQVYKIVDILEIHRFVEYGDENVGPKCLVLQHFDGQTLEWKGGGNQYKEANYELLPQPWKERLIVNLPD
jgi:hypothetical protein